MPTGEGPPGIGFSVTFREDEFPFLQDVAAQFYDLNLLFEVVAIAVLDEYGDYEFSSWTWRRNARPLAAKYRPYAGRMYHESPVFLEILTTRAAAALPRLIKSWTAAIEDVADLRARIRVRRGARQIQQLEQAVRAGELLNEDIQQEIDRRRLLAELRDGGGRRGQDLDALLTQLDQRGGLKAYTQLRNRIRTNPVMLGNVEISEAGGGALTDPAVSGEVPEDA